MVLGCAILLAGCAGGESPDQPKRPALPVEVTEVVARDVDVVVHAVGGLEAPASIELRARRAGRLVGRFGAEGTHVAAGTRLVELDAREAKAEVVLAQASVADAGARHRNAKRIFERMRELHGKGVASEQSGDDAKAEMEQAAASLGVTRARLVVVQAVLADTEITAPFAGWLGRWRVDVGAFVQPGEILGTLSNDDPLEIVFAIPERELAALALGQAVVVRTASHPGEIFSGEVTFIAPEVDPRTRTATVVGLLPNPERRLRPGQFARVELVLGRHMDAAVVPEEAVRHIGGDDFVFVVEAGQAHARRVEPGERRDGTIEIVSGLAAGEIVIRNGHGRLGLREPEAVRIVELEDDRV
ncbi:MAG: efflux RND transporter periplasmic adaptor subunit [Deltaproteobacteria bacterium]